MFKYSNYIADFLNHCRYHKKLSEKTIRAYRIDLTQYQSFSDELTKQSLWNYIEHLNKQYKPKTAKRKLATLKAFIHYLLMQDLTDYNPFDKVEMSFKEPLILPKTIPLDIISRLISFAYQQIILEKLTIKPDVPFEMQPFSNYYLLLEHEFQKFANFILRM